MKLEGDYVFEAPVADVWAALFDPVVLAAALPGCEKLELVDNHYVGELKVKVGPISGKFMGKVELKDVDKPNGYTMVVDGRGAPGFVKATASVKLETVDAGTKIRYEADAQIGGKIASVGQRLVDASARAIVKQSLDGLHENVKLRAAAVREAAAAKPAEQAIPAESAAKADAPATAEPPAPAFTPVRVKQSDLAAGVAKEVAKTLMPTLIVIGVLAFFLIWALLH